MSGRMFVCVTECVTVGLCRHVWMPAGMCGRMGAWVVPACMGVPADMCGRMGVPACIVQYGCLLSLQYVYSIWV